MVAIAVSPFVLRDVVLTIGTDSYEKHVSAVTFTPSASVQTFVGLGGNTHTDTSTATWTCNLEYAQDWGTENSLSQYLMDNEGDQVTVVFTPKSAVAGTFFTSTVTLSPGAIGGSGGAFATASVTLGCTIPVRTDPA